MLSATPSVPRPLARNLRWRLVQQVARRVTSSGAPDGALSRQLSQPIPLGSVIARIQMQGVIHDDTVPGDENSFRARLHDEIARTRHLQRRLALLAVRVADPGDVIRSDRDGHRSGGTPAAQIQPAQPATDSAGELRGYPVRRDRRKPRSGTPATTLGSGSRARQLGRRPLVEPSSNPGRGVPSHRR